MKNKEELLKTKEKKTSWSFKIFIVSWKTMTIIRAPYLKKIIYPEIVNEIRIMKEQEQRVNRENALLRKQIYLILQNLKWYMLLKKKNNIITVKKSGCSGISYSWDSWDCHGIFFHLGYRRNLRMLWDFLTKACQFFKVIILISYLLDKSSEQDIKRSQVSHCHAFSSETPI